MNAPLQPTLEHHGTARGLRVCLRTHLTSSSDTDKNVMEHGILPRCQISFQIQVCMKIWTRKTATFWLRLLTYLAGARGNLMFFWPVCLYLQKVGCRRRQ